MQTLDERMETIVKAIDEEEAGLQRAMQAGERRIVNLHMSELQILYHQKETFLRAPARRRQRIA